MIRGTDLDGVMTFRGLSNFNNSKLPWVCGLWLIFVPPNKRMIKLLRKWKEKEDEIIIISSRPKKLEGLTKWWLKRYQIPYDYLFLVDKGDGFEQRKLEIIQKTGILLFVDDNPRIVSFLRKFGVKAKFPEEVF
ncbi:MAG: hypothetical protein ACKKMS_03150 [Candidatus Nealsonbacteria bacterium]